MPIEITVNGDLQQVPEDLDVRRLLAHLNIRAERVAIERNLQILPRASWAVTQVVPGDRYEIVHLVGGGD
jgi:sulfur carrier protein